VGKIIIDESEIIDTKAMQTLERLASFFDRLDDPYRMPELMSEWLKHYNEGHKVDTYYRIPVGYSHEALSLDFMFKSEMIVMTFNLPDGTRLMELRLHV
jgi:hypothetical protein